MISIYKSRDLLSVLLFITYFDVVEKETATVSNSVCIKPAPRVISWKLLPQLRILEDSLKQCYHKVQDE